MPRPYCFEQDPIWHTRLGVPLEIRLLVAWFQTPPIHNLMQTRAGYRNPKLPPTVVPAPCMVACHHVFICECVSDPQKHCKVLWIKALYKCRSFPLIWHDNNFELSVKCVFLSHISKSFLSLHWPPVKWWFGVCACVFLCACTQSQQ